MIPVTSIPSGEGSGNEIEDNSKSTETVKKAWGVDKAKAKKQKITAASIGKGYQAPPEIKNSTQKKLVNEDLNDHRETYEKVEREIDDFKDCIDKDRQNCNIFETLKKLKPYICDLIESEGGTDLHIPNCTFKKNRSSSMSLDEFGIGNAKSIIQASKYCTPLSFRNKIETLFATKGIALERYNSQEDGDVYKKKLDLTSHQCRSAFDKVQGSQAVDDSETWTLVEFIIPLCHDYLSKQEVLAVKAKARQLYEKVQESAFKRQVEDSRQLTQDLGLLAESFIQSGGYLAGSAANDLIGIMIGVDNCYSEDLGVQSWVEELFLDKEKITTLEICEAQGLSLEESRKQTQLVVQAWQIDEDTIRDTADYMNQSMAEEMSKALEELTGKIDSARELTGKIDSAFPRSALTESERQMSDELNELYFRLAEDEQTVSEYRFIFRRIKDLKPRLESSIQQRYLVDEFSDRTLEKIVRDITPMGDDKSIKIGVNIDSINWFWVSDGYDRSLKPEVRWTTTIEVNDQVKAFPGHLEPDH